MGINKMEKIHTMPKHLDLALVILFTLLCISFVLIPPLNDTPIRIILGLPLVLFLPGYSLIAALFPRKDDIDAIERIALSFGLSIAVVPLIGLALNYTPFGIRLTPILIVLSVFTVSLALGAYVRRSKLSEDDRFVVEFQTLFEGIKNTDTKIAKRTLRNELAFTDNQKKLLSVIIFFISYTLLLLFMHNFLGGTRLIFIPFWLAIFGIIVPVVYQIYRIDLNNSTKLIIFIEIVSIILFLDLIRIMLQHNLLTLGGDAYGTLISMETIKTTTSCLSGGTMEKWPGLQLLSLSISKVSGIDSYNIALFFPIFYQILSIIFMYLLTKELYNERTAFLACAIFATFYLLAEYNSQFRPEILAYPYLFMCIFAYIKKPKNTSSRFRFSFLALLFIICIVITHYTTNAVLILFCAVMLFVYASRYIPKLKTKATIKDFIGSPLTFVLFAIVIWLAYWMYIGEPMFRLFCHSIEDLYTPISPPAAQLAYTPTPRPLTLKDEFIGRANQFYIFLFIGIMAYEIFKRRDCKSWQADFWLACWAGFIFFIWLIFGVRGGILPGLGKLMLPDARLFLFVYPFALMVVTHVIIKLQSPKKKILFNSLLVGFVLVNILMIQIIPLNPLSCTSPIPLERWDTTSDIQAANWIPSSNYTVSTSGPMLTLLPYVKKEGTSVTDSAKFFDCDMNRLKQRCDWLYLMPHSPCFKRLVGDKRVVAYLDNETVYKISNTTWLQKVYTNGKWEIYSIIP